jgi:hypothetical protein
MSGLRVDSKHPLPLYFQSFSSRKFDFKNPTGRETVRLWINPGRTMEETTLNSGEYP